MQIPGTKNRNEVGSADRGAEKGKRRGRDGRSDTSERVDREARIFPVYPRGNSIRMHRMEICRSGFYVESNRPRRSRFPFFIRYYCYREYPRRLRNAALKSGGGSNSLSLAEGASVREISRDRDHNVITNRANVQVTRSNNREPALSHLSRCRCVLYFSVKTRIIRSRFCPTNLGRARSIFDVRNLEFGRNNDCDGNLV